MQRQRQRIGLAPAAAALAARRTFIPAAVGGGGRNRAANSFAIKDESRDEHLLGENPPFWNIAQKGHVLQDDSLYIDRKAHGIPFLIDDDAALDAAYRHHQTAVEVHSVERVLLPFWLGSTAAGGNFASEVYVKDPTTMIDQYRWHEVPDYEFSYPFGDHFPFNQLCATYDPVAAYAEECCAGNHIPSMLLSRFELLQELEDMEAPPRFIPFDMTTKSAVRLLEKRINRNLIHKKASDELRKFHGEYKKCNIKFYSLVAEITKIRPVFLPAFSMQVSTVSNPTPVPLYVCGATGKAKGPTVHRTPTQTALLQGAAATTGLALGAMTAGATAAAFAAMAAAGAATRFQRLRLISKAHIEYKSKLAAVAGKRLDNGASDEIGYKWTVEDEETMEYSYREEIRAKARRRADFEQRVKEESAREEASRTGRKFSSSKRARVAKRPGSIDRDPLGYYEILGFKGQENLATAKDISKAFRSEAHKHHPDMVPPHQQDLAKDKMQRLVEAYSVLRDAKLKKEYDEGTLGRPGAQNE
jgi:hypothetical protein